MNFQKKTDLAPLGPELKMSDISVRCWIASTSVILLRLGYLFFCKYLGEVFEKRRRLEVVLIAKFEIFPHMLDDYGSRLGHGPQRWSSSYKTRSTVGRPVANPGWVLILWRNPINDLSKYSSDTINSSIIRVN